MSKKHKKHHKSEKRSAEEKPLKLVLKVGGATHDSGEYKPSDVYRHEQSTHREGHRHKNKKKKKKHKHHSEKKEKSKKRHREHGEVGEGASVHKKRKTVQEENIPPSLPALSASPASFAEKEDRSPEIPPPVKELSEASRVQLENCLDTLQRQIQRKDINGFFAWPVNDVIAPGYSSIIIHPMDFSTLKKKIDTHCYHSIEEYKSDFQLMCSNAMTYNHPDTVYYQAAKKLLNTGNKIMNKDRLASLHRTILSAEREAEVAYNVDVDTVDPAQTPLVPGKKSQDRLKQSQLDYRLEEELLFTDELTAEEIREQVTLAASQVKQKLAARCPNSKMGFLRQDKSGLTTLGVVNPAVSGGDREWVPVNLGTLTSSNVTQQGTNSLATIREDKRSRANPVSYLNYGPFGSHGPKYSSFFANLSKEDSDLVLSTYGDQKGFQYAKSLIEFLDYSGDHALEIANNLLDSLTKGEHTKTVEKLKQKKKEEEEKLSKERNESQKKDDQTDKTGKDHEKPEREAAVSSTKVKDATTRQEDIDFESLKSLTELGIDVSFLPKLEKELKEDHQSAEVSRRRGAKVEEKLNQTSEMIRDLQRTQEERLSQKPPSNLYSVPGPSDRECEIAEKLQQELKELAKQVGPAGVVSTQAVRSAIGLKSSPADLAHLDSALTPPHMNVDQIDKELMEFLESPAMSATSHHKDS